MNSECVERRLNRLRRAPEDTNPDNLYNQSLYDTQVAQLRCNRKNKPSMEKMSTGFTSPSTMKILLCILVVVLVGLGIYFFTRKSKQQVSLNLSDSSPEPPQPQLPRNLSMNQ